MAERATRAGAEVVGIDLAPALIESAQERSEQQSLEIEEHVSTLETRDGEEYWQLFSTSYGPTKTLVESLGDRREEFRDTWIEFFERNFRDDGHIVHPREYLLILGTRR